MPAWATYPLPKLHGRKCGNATLLCRVRIAAALGLPRLRGRERARLEVLRRLRKARWGAAAPVPPAPPRADTAERRQLTVMFCDLVDSTALASRLDPEDVREILGVHHQCLAKTTAQYDGFVGSYMGEGALVYFGYPQGYENDTERAVRSGLALIDAIHHLRTSEPLQVRIGIATGLVVVGDLAGIDDAQEKDVVGETPKLAARLQALAEPDTVVTAPTTRLLLSKLFE